jgi:hypothetical protein
MKYPNPGIPEKERVEMVEFSLNCIALHNHRRAVPGQNPGEKIKVIQCLLCSLVVLLCKKKEESHYLMLFYPAVQKYVLLLMSLTI